MKKGKDDASKKKKKFQLGVSESKLGNSIQEESGIPCVCNDFTGEVLRGIRMHATRFMKDLEESDMNKVCSPLLLMLRFATKNLCKHYCTANSMVLRVLSATAMQYTTCSICMDGAVL